MNLNQKFDVLRGWKPGEGAAIDESFTPTSGTTVVPGNIVTMAGDGTMGLATSPDLTSVTPLPVWMAVMAGDFDNTFTGKFVAVRGNVMVKTDVFDSGSYDEGVQVSYNAGKICVAANKSQIIGEVVEDNRSAGLADGTLTIMFTGGMARAF